MQRHSSAESRGFSLASFHLKNQLTMEEDQIETTKEALRQWIRERVMKNELVSSGVLEKLQSLLERREKQVALLLKLSESVIACEAVVKKLYSLIGWEDDDTSGGGDAPPSLCESIHSEIQGCHSTGRTSLSPKLPDSQHLNRDNGEYSSTLSQPVVVLKRLSASEIRALCRPKSSKHRNKNKFSWVLDSDEQRESENESSNSDFIPSNKRRKMDGTSRTKPKDRTDVHAAREAVKTSRQQTELSAPSDSTNEDTEATHNKPQWELHVNTRVVAKRRTKNWQQGKIVQIVTKEGGQVKYKVRFEERGKRLVSAHHIAFDCSSKGQQLFVGARVVIKTQANPPHFHPGFLAEMPSGRNNMRFLVFFDDHSPVYVSLPVVHLVCKPLRNPLDDIENDTHRKFMMAYLDSWPCVPLAQYKEGQLISAEFNGVQQECEVLEADSSLIKVVFKVDEHEEWIYRGSPRLKHLIKMWKNLNPH